jgi:hypothetical protein
MKLSFGKDTIASLRFENMAKDVNQNLFMDPNSVKDLKSRRIEMFT